MKLYYFPLTSNNRKVLAVIHHLGLAPQMQVVNLL
jgi:glutathione S-transferase